MRESHLDAMKMIILSHFTAASSVSEENIKTIIEEYSNYEMKLKDIIQNEIPKIEYEIEYEFRQILGVID